MTGMPSVRSLSALIFEPLKHIHSIPAFFNFSLSRPTTLFSVSFYSTLKTPISPAVSFESTPIASFLLKDCGFSLEDANSICRRKPDLLAHKSYENSRQTLLFLRDKGFHEISIQKLFSECPNILRYGFQYTVKPKVEFLEKIGITGQKLIKTIHRYPTNLGLSISRTLEPRVCFLQSVLDPDLAVVASNPESDKIPGSRIVFNHSITLSVIYANPRILSIPITRSLGLVKDVEGLGIERGSKAFARAFLQFSTLNRDTVKRKFEILRELGFTEEEVRILVKKFPKLLGMSKERLRQNFKFLVEEWKLPRNVILTHPVALGYSTEKRLKPRLNALRASMMENKSSNKSESYPSVQYMYMSDEDFHRKVPRRLSVAT